MLKIFLGRPPRPPSERDPSHTLPYTAYAVVLTKYCLNHCARMCCSLRIVTRCRFLNWPIRCEQSGRNVLFLSINLISFRQSRGIVLVMASPAREMDSAGRQWNIEKDVRNVRDFSVKRLPSGSTISVWLNKRNTLLCVPTGTRNCVFWSRPNPHRDRPRHCQWASSLVQRVCDWPDSYRQSTLFGIGLKSAPRWRYGADRLALTQWLRGSNLTTSFGV